MRVEDIATKTGELAELGNSALFDLRSRALQMFRTALRDHSDIERGVVTVCYDILWREMERRGIVPVVTEMERAVLAERLRSVAKQEDNWRAIPYSHHGDKSKADEETAWDAGAEQSGATTAQLKTMCLFENRAKPDNKTSYKMPHHKQNGTVVWRGVTAAMARINQTKGIAESEIKKGYNHLVKHYKQFEKKAPDWEDLKLSRVKRDWVGHDGVTRSVLVRKALDSLPEVKGVLYFKAQIDDSPLGEQVWDWIERDYLNGMSWSGWPTVVEDYRLPDKHYSIVKEIDMSEISAVTLPGDENTGLRIVDEEKRIIEGTVTSENMNYLYEFVMPEAFEQSIVRYMQKPPRGTLFLNHNTDKPIGKFLDLRVEKAPVTLVAPSDTADRFEGGHPSAYTTFAKAEYNCECLDCGHKFTLTDEHCNVAKCPECGKENCRRVERPGPGQKTKKESRFQILKFDEEKHEVGGIVYAPKVLDSQGDWATPDDIHEAMVDWMIASREVDIMHDRFGKGADTVAKHEGLHVIECFQAEADTPKGKGIVPAGAWYLCVKVDVETEPDVWSRVKAASLAGFSLDGTAG